MTRATHREQAHPTSMAVWGAPSPIVMQSSFNVKVGVKCAAGCPLGGALIVVLDEGGARIGEGRLGDAPWAGSDSLYVAELTLVAPDTEAVFRWSASFTGDESVPAHESASALFSFRTMKPADHTVVVKVTDRDTGAALEGVTVFMDIYRATTDAHGAAVFELPKSTYQLKVRKRDGDAPAMTVAVDSDATVEIKARPIPDASRDELELWM